MWILGEISMGQHLRHLEHGDFCSKRGEKYDRNLSFSLFKNPVLYLQYINKKQKEKINK